MSVRILHLADLHIGYAPGYLGKEKAVIRQEDFKDAFRRSVDYAVDTANRISAVLIAGDLFETYKPNQADRGFVRAQLGRLSSAAIPVLVIPGTHDSMGLPGSVYGTETFPSEVHLLTLPFSETPLELVLDGERFSFYWFTYAPGEATEVGEFLRRVKEKPPADGYRVFIAHASVTGSPEWDMRRKDLPVSGEDLLSSQMHYVALGHYHNFCRLESQQTLAVYPGTLEGKSFGENGPRHLVTVSFEGGRARIEKQVFNRRTLEEKTLSLDSEGVATEEELLDRIGSLGREELLLKLTLTGNSDFAVRADFLEEALLEKFFHIEIEDDTSVLSSVLAETLLEEKTIRGMFVRKLKKAMLSLPESERAIYELALKEGLSSFSQKGITSRSRDERDR
jgi:DNA repair exonuclease SbcCD nuclease subunit